MRLTTSIAALVLAAPALAVARNPKFLRSCTAGKCDNSYGVTYHTPWGAITNNCLSITAKDCKSDKYNGTTRLGFQTSCYVKSCRGCA